MRFTVVRKPNTNRSMTLVYVERLGEGSDCWLEVPVLCESEDSYGNGLWSQLFDEETLRKLTERLPERIAFLGAHTYKSGELEDANLFDSKRKIVAIGLNYRDHADEFGDEYPTEPLIFCKASSAINHSGGDIVLPETSSRVDYEGELVAVIGKTCRNVSVESALDYVFGYCCGNDVSARDWQKGKPGGQWFLGKSFDSFAPIGPMIVTADEVGDPNSLKIETRLNGVTVQSSHTSRMIFKVSEIISYVSGVMTLQPGDLVFTGTPNGVGDARRPPLYLHSGDIVEVEIEKLGVLRSRVK